MTGVSNAGRIAGVLVAAVFATTAVADDDLEGLQREWWQWAMAIPASQNPIYDKTGKNCGIGQRGEYWFLAGSTGGKVTRSCTVPKGVKLLVPVVNNFCFPDAGYPDQACIDDSNHFIESFDSADLSLTLDQGKVRIDDVRDEASPASGTVFVIAVGPNGFGGTKPGLYRVNIARGLWGVVDTDLLNAGPHTLTINAQGPMFGLSVTYLLDVAEPSN